MRELFYLMLLAGCSTTPLDIPVGQIVDSSRVEWNDRIGGFWSTTFEQSDGDLVLKAEDFEQLLDRCRIKEP